MDHALSLNGFAVIPDVLSPQQLSDLLAALASDVDLHQPHAKGGIRNLLDRVPKVDQLAQSPSIRQLV